MRRMMVLLMVFLLTAFATGCGLASQERIKLRDLDFSVLSEEVIPKELAELIKEKKEESFWLSYTDENNLYICVGYGKQSSGGYSITVNELYLADDGIYVNTSLLGPQKGTEQTGNSSYPYIVIKTEKLDKTVIFE